MSRKAKILIVEDEEAIRVGLIDVLIYHGYQPDAVADGQSGLDKALSGTYDLILLDVMLPKLDGFEVCDQIRRADREQAIIMLTAKSGDDDIIRGLQLGADDYVAKPFSIAQLVLRIKAVLRRSGGDIDAIHSLQFGALEIDSRNYSGMRDGEAVQFTRREIELLQYLHSHHERPVPREELLSKLWGYGRDLGVETRTVDIHIAKLRRKIEPDPANPTYLQTVRGAGYRLMVS
ncbi:MAG: DNA-binding response regulator [Gammaproteobacteria bacterium]|nr:MAG: DNA-binding response regulator [Gammaproteobacteria bacterium]